MPEERGGVVDMQVCFGVKAGIELQPLAVNWFRTAPLNERAMRNEINSEPSERWVRATEKREGRGQRSCFRSLMIQLA